MNHFENFSAALETAFRTEQIIKESPRGSVQVIRHCSSGSRYLLRRFTGSGQVYRQLLTVSSPFLPTIYETAEQDGQVLVLEEYVQGDTAAFLLQADCFSERQARRAMKQLCRGLWVLHSLGAVHRDIKPENVLFRGSDAVLIDFDAARLYQESSSADTQILGTTGYAAPEQYGFTQSDHRADLYAMGVLLNVLLTGKHPSRQLAAGPLGRVVQKCTMLSPDKRYQSALELMEVL